MSLYKYFKFAKTAINISLIVATGVFLWPGALAAVTGFSMFGYSIATLVGPSALLQIGAVAGATFVGLHALELSLTVVGGLFSMLKYCFSASNSHNQNQQSPVKVIYVNQPYQQLHQARHDGLAQTDNPEPHQASYKSILYPTIQISAHSENQSGEYQPLYPNIRN